MPVMTDTASVRLAPGDPAPDFTLPDAEGKPVTLSSYRGRRVIVYCYPAALTPGCTTQAVDFTAAAGGGGGGGGGNLRTSPPPPGENPPGPGGGEGGGNPVSPPREQGGP